MSNIKTINGLMKYLRNNHNIKINGSTDKQKLKCVGYYHGYKGYRYIKKPNNRINFSSFDEIMSIIDFDNKVKSILYPQVMFIETALKSYVLEMIIQEGKTESFSEIYSKIMTGYKSYPTQGEQYKKAYKKRLDTYNRIHMAIASAFSADNNIVSHYLKNDENVPIWGIFEIITLGEFGNLISTFDLNIRQDIAKDIGFNIAYDSKGILVEKSIFIMKDLRNAIAHNNVIFDTRFNTNPINNTFKNMIMNDMKISDIFFNCITDYIIFVSYMLKKLKRTKNEIKKFINDYNKVIDELRGKIPKNIFDQIILTNDIQKLNKLMIFIKNKRIFYKILHIIKIYIIIYIRKEAEVFGRCLKRVDFRNPFFFFLLSIHQNIP